MFAKNILSWKRTKELRVDILGYRCELCGSDVGFLVGHHINGKLHSGKNRSLGRVSTEGLEEFYGWRACQLRCVTCEFTSHWLFKGGNSAEAKKIQIVNNEIISQALESRLRLFPDVFQATPDFSRRVAV